MEAVASLKYSRILRAILKLKLRRIEPHLGLLRFEIDLYTGRAHLWPASVSQPQLFDAATGNPLTITSGRTLAYTPLAAEGNSTADFSGRASSIRPTTDSLGRRILVTEAQRAQFSFPAAGSPGTAGRNAFRNSGFWNMNFSMYKNLRVTERSKLQFRSEFFNVFSHAVMENLPEPQQRRFRPVRFSTKRSAASCNSI